MKCLTIKFQIVIKEHNIHVFFLITLLYCQHFGSFSFSHNISFFLSVLPYAHNDGCLKIENREFLLFIMVNWIIFKALIVAFFSFLLFEWILSKPGLISSKKGFKFWESHINYLRSVFGCLIAKERKFFPHSKVVVEAVVVRSD